VLQPEHLFWLEDKLSFPLAVFRPPLKWVRSWKRELEFKEREKKSLSALKSGSSHIALAVQYKPPPGV
jgi:hypothetical protein